MYQEMKASHSSGQRKGEMRRQVGALRARIRVKTHCRLSLFSVFSFLVITFLLVSAPLPFSWWKLMVILSSSSNNHFFLSLPPVVVGEDITILTSTSKKRRAVVGLVGGWLTSLCLLMPLPFPCPFGRGCIRRQKLTSNPPTIKTNHKKTQGWKET